MTADTAKRAIAAPLMKIDRAEMELKMGARA
jgi:hypothetical protein